MTDDEFDDFYASSAQRLVGLLFAMTGDLAEAQDAVQEAFVRAWDRRRELDHAASPEAWVRTVAWRIAVSRWRQAQATRRFRGFRTVGQIEPPGEDVVVLVAALRKLPESHRRVLVLHHLCDVSVEDVAREIGAPVGTVKAWLARGRRALAQILAETESEEIVDAAPRG